MALPKRRHSRTRGAKRRTHWKLARASVQSCPSCHKPKRPHRVCSHCGAYDGRDVVPPSET
jgi:large subunit ribosomal protein L32